jgi:hypothetical protein
MHHCSLFSVICRLNPRTWHRKPLTGIDAPSGRRSSLFLVLRETYGTNGGASLQGVCSAAGRARVDPLLHAC